MQSLKLSATSKDSTFSLGAGKEGSARLFVPSGAIPEGQDLHVRYAVLLDGPFSIPENYVIVSPVLYIDYDTSLVKKPLELHLNHWYAGKDRQKTMTFLKAPHVANGDGVFPFTMDCRRAFSDDELIAVLEPSKDLCLICDAVQCTVQFGFPADCLLYLLQKTKNDNCVFFRLYVTFANSLWDKVSMVLFIVLQSSFSYTDMYVHV